MALLKWNGGSTILAKFVCVLYFCCAFTLFLFLILLIYVLHIINEKYFGKTIHNYSFLYNIDYIY